jgi:hypothetical protein
MAINFEYDLGETVRIGGRDVILRKAVADYIGFAKSPSPHQSKPQEWVRVQGKKPRILEADHMEQLAALPIFSKSPR